MRRPCTRSEIYFEFAKVASEEQLARFEQYKRSKLPRAAMRRLMHDIVGTSTERCAIILVRPALCYPPPPRSPLFGDRRRLPLVRPPPSAAVLACQVVCWRAGRDRERVHDGCWRNGAVAAAPHTRGAATSTAKRDGAALPHPQAPNVLAHRLRCVSTLAFMTCAQRSAEADGRRGRAPRAAGRTPAQVARALDE